MAHLVNSLPSMHQSLGPIANPGLRGLYYNPNISERQKDQEFSQLGDPVLNFFLFCCQSSFQGRVHHAAYLYRDRANDPSQLPVFHLQTPSYCRISPLLSSLVRVQELKGLVWNCPFQSTPHDELWPTLNCFPVSIPCLACGLTNLLSLGSSVFC